MNITIPKIIHQTYKTSSLPPELNKYRSTWIEKHPDWEFKLWSDLECRNFIRNNYHWFLDIYDNYPRKIMRIDAVRYFLLHFFGGLYIDLDFECIKNIEPLLINSELVLGKEPSIHSKIVMARERKIKEIICNALMASTPGNSFWDHVFKELERNKNKNGVLDTTGPFFLTKALQNYKNKEFITILEPEFIYPISNKETWNVHISDNGNIINDNVFAVHHWSGSWTKRNINNQHKIKSYARMGIKLLKHFKRNFKYLFDKRRIRKIEKDLNTKNIENYWKLSGSNFDINIEKFINGKPCSEGLIEKTALMENSKNEPESPLISCLMVTKDRFDHARTAVISFLNQTYTNKELVIIDDGECNRLKWWTEELNRREIIFYKLPHDGKKLGRLRNIGIQNCAGEYITQWDDDDFSHPERLELQFCLLKHFDAEACFLSRHQIIFPHSRELYITQKRIWEGSFLCNKKLIKKYPDFSKGEDTPVINDIFLNCSSVLLDYPKLYSYVFHKKNTHTENHFKFICNNPAKVTRGRQFYDELDYILEENILDKYDFYKRYNLKNPREEIDKPYSRKEYKSGKRSQYPEIMILTPAKNAADSIEIYFNNLKRLTYPHKKISIGILESDSEDNTLETLRQYADNLKNEFNSIKVINHDFGVKLEGPRWKPQLQLKRRATIAKCRNILLSRILKDEDWVLWIDIDVGDWPENIIELLLDAQKNIVVPSCVALNGDAFDLNTYKFKGSAGKINWSNYIIDNIMQSPIGEGRTYLTYLKDYDCVEVDSVGGTMLLIKADLHREGLNFPSFPYKYFIETEGLAMMAKDMGYKCWGLPNVEIVHYK